MVSAAAHLATILVVAAHPDDEVLGCAGTIANLVRQGGAVHIAFFADVVGARGSDAALNRSALEQRRTAATSAAAILGAASVRFDDLPDNRLDNIPLLDITQRVEALIAKHRYATVLTDHAGELNIDHRFVHQAVVTACRP